MWMAIHQFHSFIILALRDGDLTPPGGLCKTCRLCSRSWFLQISPWRVEESLDRCSRLLLIPGGWRRDVHLLWMVVEGRGARCTHHPIKDASEVMVTESIGWTEFLHTLWIGSSTNCMSPEPNEGQKPSCPHCVRSGYKLFLAVHGNGADVTKRYMLPCTLAVGGNSLKMSVDLFESL